MSALTAHTSAPASRARYSYRKRFTGEIDVDGSRFVDFVLIRSDAEGVRDLAESYDSERRAAAAAEFLNAAEALEVAP